MKTSLACIRWKETPLILKNALISMHLRIENDRGQCYAGAATMAGENSGVATQIMNE